MSFTGDPCPPVAVLPFTQYGSPTATSPVTSVTVDDSGGPEDAGGGGGGGAGTGAGGLPPSGASFPPPPPPPHAVRLDANKATNHAEFRRFSILLIAVPACEAM